MSIYNLVTKLYHVRYDVIGFNNPIERKKKVRNLYGLPQVCPRDLRYRR